MFDPQTWTDPEKQNPNQPQRQPILNFTLKIPETPKTWGGHPRNVDPQTRPEPEKQTQNPTRPRLLLPDYITSEIVDKRLWYVNSSLVIF